MLQNKSLTYLEKLLGLDRGELRRIAEGKAAYYEERTLKEVDDDGHTKLRKIRVATGDLLTVHEKIKSSVLKGAPSLLPENLPAAMKGGVKRASIHIHAALHVGKDAVGWIDISKCFPSITPEMVYRVWQRDFGFTKEASRLLTDLTTVDNQLPQGTVTSSALCNLTLKPLFIEVNTYCEQHGLQASIWVDDIYFSGSISSVEAAIGPISAIVRRYSLSPKSSKTKIMKSGSRQVVTGLPVNKKVGINRKRYERVRKTILASTREALEKGELADKISGHISNFGQSNGKYAEQLRSLIDRKKP